VPDESHRSHDTDPLADTQTSDPPSDASEADAGGTVRIRGKLRAVHVGDTLGRYELLEDVGEGGMATVYRARDTELRREVAVKVLFPHLARRPEIVHRFHREARAAAGLEHANILRVYDVGGGEQDDPPYIVMELIRGRSLLGEIELRGPMLSEVVACIGALLADALGVAHQAGIVHRDVKPANVMIATGGRVLLADFGVARLETEDSLVTKTGALLGTPAYMSPEQASGDTATARSDLYSLGATLYQLATGSLPYTGSPAKVLAQLAQGTLVPATRRRGAVGPELSRVLDRLMAVEPEARPRSAIEVATELRAIASASGLGDPADELAAYFTDPERFLADKLPGVVTATIAAAEQAIADDKLPRALALADRAGALAPDDPAVTALIRTVTEGGKASRRRRVLALAGAGVVIAGGAVVAGLQVFAGGGSSAHGAVAADADMLAMLTLDDAAPPPPADADERVAEVVDAGVPRPMLDAGSRPRPDAPALRRPDAGVMLADAAVTAPPDAAALVPVIADAAAPPSPGGVIVKNDLWCDVTIDGMPLGRNSGRPYRVEPGRRTVTCAQPGTANTWTRTVDVAAGATVTVEGAMRGRVVVTLAVDATINGVPHARGTTVELPIGRYPLVIGDRKAFFDLRTPCTVRATPEPGCY
jgi:eukaryotic-like serine/threonine-protein kinase